MSSGSDSDEDFVPGEPEQLSEEGSADEETDLQYEQDFQHKAKKRKAKQASNNKGKKKSKTRNGVKETVPEPEERPEQPEETDPEEDKKREEDLWAKFLEGTDTKPKPAPKESAPKTVQTNTSKPLVENNKDKAAKKYNDAGEDNKARERRIFEFAGETIVVEDNVIKEKIKTAESDAPGANLEGPSSRKSGGGLSGVLDAINRKNKLSTLEKSKLDWMTYKKEEGIEEEIESHNKGKTGFLDRRDFLERADYRQYEIERDLRMSRRSNR